MSTVDQATDARTALIADLRAFADLLERRPDMPAPPYVHVQHSLYHRDFPSDEQRIAEVERLAAVLGVEVERTDKAVVAVLPLGRVEYTVHAMTIEGSARYDAEASYRGAVEPEMAVAR
jgi:hypothetical protein